MVLCVWPLVPDLWTRSDCGQSPSWTSSLGWTRWRNPSRPQPSCHPVCQRFPWTNHRRHTLSAVCVPARQAETPPTCQRCNGTRLFIRAGVVLSMLISSTTLLQVYSSNKLCPLEDQLYWRDLESEGSQGRHESLEEEINFHKLYESVCSYC